MTNQTNAVQAVITDLPADPRFCCGLGQYDHRKPTLHNGSPNPKTGQPFGTITLQQIANMLPRPPVSAKGSGPWMLASALATPEARSFDVQAEQGVFQALMVDIDKGNLPLDWVNAAVGALLPGCRALIYSSATAQPANRKWHVVVPLSMPIPYKAFRAFQLALFRGFEHNGAKVDRSLVRSAQLYYLPSVPYSADGILNAPYYEWNDLSGELFTPDAGHLAFRSLAREYFLEEQEQEISESKGHGPHSVIGWVARNYDTEDLLERFGYVTRNGKDWASLMQQASGGRHGTLLRDNGAWASMSESDRAAGLGKPARKSDARWGDAFDLIKFYVFGNNEDEALRWAYAARQQAEEQEHAELRAFVGGLLK